MQLSEHFELSEFLSAGDPNSPSSDQIERMKVLCETFLEKVRAHYNSPIKIHSGFRSLEYNNLPTVGGAQGSYHIYEGDHAAADFEVIGHDYVEVFDWIRLESFLPFDEVILERNHTTNRPACVHVQIHVGAANRYYAKVGETHGTGTYTAVAVNRPPAEDHPTWS